MIYRVDLKHFLLTLIIIPIILTGCENYSSNGLMRTELDNGMVILTRRFDNLPIVAVSVWAKVGSSYEKEGEYGISHFLEHMLFRRVPASEKQGSLQTEIEGSGGYLNGATGKEITYYFAVVPKDFSDEALNLLLDLFLKPDLNEKDFKEEKKVVIEEISRKNDNPADLLDDELYEVLYSGHPYGHPVLGDVETIKTMELDSLRRYHEVYYRPDNMVVSIVGNFAPRAVLKKLKAEFNRLPKREKIFPATAKIKKGARKKTIEKNVNQLYFSLGFAGPAVKNEDHLALDLLTFILGQGASSRLVERLKEKERLVNSVSSQFFTQRQSGLFSIYAQFLPENLERVEAVIWDELERLKQEPVGSSELEKAKRMIEANFYFQHEIFKDQALAHAYWECLGAGNYEKDYLDKIKKIDAKTLKKAASEYLNLENSANVIIKPPS